MRFLLYQDQGTVLWTETDLGSNLILTAVDFLGLGFLICKIDMIPPAQGLHVRI